jgi:hypothetical protein
MSIQTLVMEQNIIEKEPGYEGYDTDGLENQTYANIVKYGNVKHAMLCMLRSPPAGFEEVVRAHFRLSAPKILPMLDKWLEEAESVTEHSCDSLVSCHNQSTLDLFNEKGYKTALSEAVEELKVALNELM